MLVRFSDHPRRIVTMPDSRRVLVLVRRNVGAKFSWNNWDMAWDFQQAWRLLRRDRRWRVELYLDVHDDPGGVPRDEAGRFWVAANRSVANGIAERVSDALRVDGLAGLHSLDS